MQSICGQTCCLSFYSTQGIQSLTIFFRIIYILYLSGFVFSFFVGWQLMNSKLIYTFMCCRGVHREMQPRLTRLTVHWTRTNCNNCNKAIKPLVLHSPKRQYCICKKICAIQVFTRNWIGTCKSNSISGENLYWTNLQDLKVYSLLRNMTSYGFRKHVMYENVWK